MARSPGSAIVALLLVVLGGGWYLLDKGGAEAAAGAAAAAQPSPVARDPARAAFDSHASGRVITVQGTVERILADDRDGSPHQRFIIRTSGGVSLLIAHNLDLAPRLAGLKTGESIAAMGEYEWNEKGGVMHWTHRDPQGRHVAGYIEWRGRRYQ